MPTKGKQSKFPERPGQNIDVCEGVRHCGAAQTHNFIFPAQTSPLKRKFDPQFHLNLQELRFPKPLVNCIMNTSSSGFVSPFTSLAFIFQMQEDTQSFSHHYLLETSSSLFFFPSVNHATHNQLLYTYLPIGTICNVILFL